MTPRECFSCGASQVDLRDWETTPRPTLPRHVDLCEDCAKTFRKAGFLIIPAAAEPSDFALKLGPALASTQPGSPSTG